MINQNVSQKFANKTPHSLLPRPLRFLVAFSASALTFSTIANQGFDYDLVLSKILI
jgi:hypothetical protein